MNYHKERLTIHIQIIFLLKDAYRKKIAHLNVLVLRYKNDNFWLNISATEVCENFYFKSQNEIINL